MVNEVTITIIENVRKKCKIFTQKLKHYNNFITYFQIQRLAKKKIDTNEMITEIIIEILLTIIDSAGMAQFD